MRALLALALTLGVLSGSASAQQAAPNRVRVFLDCAGEGCDSEEFRTEIQFVDWVREASVADVHIIITDQDTGAGTQHVIDLIGRNALQSLTDRLTLTTSDTDTREELLRGITSLLKAGLTRYLAHHGRAADVSIGMARARAEPSADAAAPARDPWNYWVFRVGFDADVEGESQQNDRSLNASLSANRTTMDWRIDLELDGDFNRRRVELNEGDDFINNTDDWQVSGLIVRSVRRHWSSGAEFSISTSTRFNHNRARRSAGALEYSFFPYEEANRRALLLHYQLGISDYRYQERTIFDKLQETVADHRLSLSYSTRQTWGDASLSLQYAAILRDWAKNRLAGEAGFSVRLLRGLELEVSGGYDRIRDQIYLPAEGMSDEEIIAQRRELATEYQYEMQFGLSYRFGSVLNNFVNNRFPFNLLD
jgi:hypothetical protein